MIDPIKLGIYILFFLPGFIFLQIKDRHLLIENKGQFEKVMEIILWSAFIWVMCIAIFWFVSPINILKLDKVIFSIKEGVVKQESLVHAGHRADITIMLIGIIKEHFLFSIIFFFSTCLFAFIAATVWGGLGRISRIEKFFRVVNKGDSVTFTSVSFFRNNIGKPVLIKTSDKTYIGQLYRAPDNISDEHLIIDTPYILSDKVGLRRIEGVEKLLIKCSELESILAYHKEFLRDKEEMKAQNERREKWLKE